MADPHSRHGWAYSLFAGLVALPIAAWFVWLQHLSRPFLVAVAMTFAAIVLARLAAWLAILSGGRDHGWRATAYTGLFYLVFCGALVVILVHDDIWQLAQQQGALLFAWWFFKQTLGGIFFVLVGFAPWTLVPACVVGTLAFHALIRVRTPSN
jgi:hypothetical protein